MTADQRIEGPQIVFAVYRPRAGQADALKRLVKQHHPVLVEIGLATVRTPIIVQSSDDTIVEIFEWVSGDASARAHSHPDVARIWEAKGQIADFVSLSDLPEAKRSFAHFAPLTL